MMTEPQDWFSRLMRTDRQLWSCLMLLKGHAVRRYRAAKSEEKKEEYRRLWELVDALAPGLERLMNQIERENKEREMRKHKPPMPPKRQREPPYEDRNPFRRDPWKREPFRGTRMP